MVPRQEPFLQRLNPLTKLAVVLCIIILAFLLPWTAASLLLFGLVLALVALGGRILGQVLLACLRLVLPAALVLFLMQGLFYHGGKTVLLVLGPFSIKTEGLAFAGLISSRILVMISAFSTLFASTTPGELTASLQQAGLPGSLAYVISSSLQLLPETRQRVIAIQSAQRARGLHTRGSLLVRVRALLPLVVPLVSNTLVTAEERAIALELRSFRSHQKPTSWSEIPDSYIQRVFRWFCLFVVLGVGVSRLLW